MKRLRVYADTSVFGGCFDPEFEAASTAFFREVAAGRFRRLKQIFWSVGILVRLPKV
jgi:hypothetical protein